jgi:hypothetical protein
MVQAQVGERGRKVGRRQEQHGRLLVGAGTRRRVLLTCARLQQCSWSDWIKDVQRVRFADLREPKVKLRGGRLTAESQVLAVVKARARLQTKVLEF